MGGLFVLQEHNTGDYNKFIIEKPPLFVLIGNRGNRTSFSGSKSKLRSQSFKSIESVGNTNFTLHLNTD